MNPTLRAVTTGLLSIAAATISAEADAHIRLDAPAARFEYSGAGQKTGPCGSGTATGTVTEVQAGSTLTVEWTETINHPGHYRISIDPNGGDDDLVDPASETDEYTNDTVLLDMIADKAGGAYSADITIPGTNCEKCTLQLIQVMTDKLPWGPQNGDDIYYWCADIKIVGGTDPVDPSTSSSAASTGSTTSSSASTTSASGSSGAGGAGEGGAGEGGAGGGTSLDGDDGGCTIGAGRRDASGVVAVLGLVAAGFAARRRRER